jgi:hypothetical protein
MNHSKFADKVLQDTKNQIAKENTPTLTDVYFPKILTPDGLLDTIGKITQDYKRNNNL